MSNRRQPRRNHHTDLWWTPDDLEPVLGHPIGDVCPDCKSSSVIERVAELRSEMTTFHDPTCPWMAAYTPSEPMSLPNAMTLHRREEQAPHG